MTDNIIKLLNLEDSDLIVEGPIISNGKKVLTLTKELVPAFCPICGTKMHSKGIYTRLQTKMANFASPFWRKLQAARQDCFTLREQRYRHCKCQYKNVGLVENKCAGKLTFIFSTFLVFFS